MNYELLIIFVLGLCTGSFLGVVVERLPRGKDFFKGRSRCDNCRKSLGILDLVPIFSFIFLKGRCRFCKTKLSLFYPLIELITGVLFVIVFFNTSNTIEILYYLFIVSSLIALFFIDLKYGILPFSIIFPATLISFLYLLLHNSHLPATPASLLAWQAGFIIQNLLSAVGAFAFFLFLFGITRGRGMGFGDVVYVFFMGLMLGFPKIILGLYIAFISGAVISIILIGVKKKKLKGSTVPFGPFLVAGTLIAMFWGDKLIDLIFNLLLK